MTTLLKDFRPRLATPRPARALPSPLTDGIRMRLESAEAALAEDFKGITTDGTVVPGLFSIEKTGIPTDQIKYAASAFLESVNTEDVLFPVDSDAWRQWSNIHPYLMRHGLCLDDMSTNQREMALALLKESLSPAGFETARNIMRLNESIREITSRDEEYGEWLYWLSVMGAPSLEAPWGWQIDGHHLIVNCFILGDQVVMTPMFMGSEPVAVDTGKYAGTRVFQAEEQAGLALAQTLTKKQRSTAILSEDLPGEVFTTAFRDNFELKYEGIRCDELSSNQQSLLVGLLDAYIGRMRPGHARVKMQEVKQHLGETHLAWMGGTGEDSVFYYRIHSPVILVEFDHQHGIALDNDEPSRQHIHTVVRTPNGNDYGKDLLRQHRQQVDHSHS